MVHESYTYYTETETNHTHMRHAHSLVYMIDEKTG